MGLLAVASSLSACGKSEPTYSGISVLGRNFLPYNMSGFTITDAYRERAAWMTVSGTSRTRFAM